MMKRVAITGASGSMGFAAYKELMQRKDRYETTMLVRPSKKNIKMFKNHLDSPKDAVQGAITEKDGVRIVWGCVTDESDVAAFVKDADIVINMAAIIPPKALKSKRGTDAVNIGSVENILKAIKATPGGAETIKFITVSSIAVYGDRLPPYHMVEIGDPVYPSIGDFYALTKVQAERKIVESGLKYWAVIRQTFITIENLFTLMDPLMYHQPVDQRIEPVTFRDSGYGIINCVDAPEEFWRNIYNMSGGKKFRIVYHEFLNRMFGLFGLNSYKCMKRNWFTLRNFHCAWYTDEDSERLNRFADYQRDSYEDYFDIVKKNTPAIFKAAKIVPSFVVRLFMRLYAEPVKWAKNPEKYPAHLSSYYGTQRNWQLIPDWDQDLPKHVEPKKIELGYTRKEDGKYSISDMQQLADFRGGECLSSDFTDMYTPLKWKCHVCGCEFDATPMLVTNGGHWCPDCEPPVWNFDEIARKNKFLAQVHYNKHDENEYRVYSTAEILKERGIKD